MRDGKLVSVNEVPSGLASGCTCPACGAALVAKKGRARVHHFAHASLEDCGLGFESAVHLMAKEIIERRREIQIPPVTYKPLPNSPVLIISPTLRIKLDDVKLEKRVGDIIPDLIVSAGTKSFLVEVFVTHKVDLVKAQRIRSLGLSALEIDLSEYSSGVVPDNFEKIVVEDIIQKRWVHNEAANRFGASLDLIPQTRQAVHRGLALHVDYCPIRAREWKGKPYANVIDDCSGCTYLSSWDQDEISCTGHIKAKVDELINRYSLLGRMARRET
jgi:hypothetical protein